MRFFSPFLSLKYAGCCLLIAGLLLQGPAARAAEEYAVKAAFVFNFIKFTQWPDDHFKDASSPIRLCYLGSGDSAKHFFALDGKPVGGRKIKVHQTEDLTICLNHDIIFVQNRLPQAQLNRLISSSRDRCILTIGETEGFAGRGGVINFFSADARLQFEINPGTAREKGIKLSSRLLKLAVIVE